jgi:CxxC-x17-CxxC domain-containing protein
MGRITPEPHRRVVHQATCSLCGLGVVLPFAPRADRPV